MRQYVWGLTMIMYRMRFAATRAMIITTMLALSGEAGAQVSTIPPCPALLDKLPTDAQFQTYATPVSELHTRHAKPNVKTGKAHLYRTVIREETKNGPDFADHYKIISISCGAATRCLAIADIKTGRIYFPTELQSATALIVDTADTNIETLNYRRNSRLLVVIGSPNEEPKKAGISYYVWQSGILKLIRFLPAYKVCELPPTTLF